MALPAIAWAAIAAGVAGLGYVIYQGTAQAQVPAPEGPPPCPPMDPTGGTLDGIQYREKVIGGAADDATLPMVILFHSRGSTAQSAINYYDGRVETPVRLIAAEGIVPTLSCKSDK